MNKHIVIKPLKFRLYYMKQVNMPPAKCVFFKAKSATAVLNRPVHTFDGVISLTIVKTKEIDHISLGHV